MLNYYNKILRLTATLATITYVAFLPPMKSTKCKKKTGRK